MGWPQSESIIRVVLAFWPWLTLSFSIFRWVHIAYSLQALYLLPLRAYNYKKRSWHYFLFDLCYYANIINFLFLWVFPSSAPLWVASYCLSHGSLASAVITWRNSLVFHDSDKVTSLFIHLYPPFTFTVIRCVLTARLTYWCDLVDYFVIVISTLEPNSGSRLYWKSRI